MTKRLRYILTLFALLVCGTVSAQYYSWGADPESMRWQGMKSDGISVIYPDTAEYLGHKLMHYVRAVKPNVGFGFRRSTMNVPFVVHPENAISNGMVMWMPKRVEIISSPDINSYSMLWLKQLAAHEYRHVVQYNNLNRGWVRAFSYLLGQQSNIIGLLFMPLWGMEGDAVISETQMSTYGRALQPSFTMHYRALGEDILKRKSIDKWFCGSYRDYVPDHYQLGYQITSYANTKYDENIWDKIIHFSVRNPYVFATTAVGMKRFYNTSTGRLFRETFADLNRFWTPLAQYEDSSTRIPTPTQRSYTTYRYPMPFGERHVISLKEDLDRPTALVSTNVETGEEERICYTGRISTRPTMKDGRIWWTEYRRSLLYQQRVNSRLCYVDLNNRKPRTVLSHRNVQFPTVIEGCDSLAWVEYRPSGTYAVALGVAKGRRTLAEMPQGVELHSLTYDNKTQRLYFIATSDEGMWLGRVNTDGSYAVLTEPAYITISDLQAQDGVLYFGSIESGKDEVHCYDLATGEEFRISNSRYGSFSPMPMWGERLLMTTYDKEGYHLAQQSLDRNDMIRVQRSLLPQNVVNPPRKKWDLINLDTVRFEDKGVEKSKREFKPRRYSKLAHLFNIHSWAPASYNPFALTEGNVNFNLGATVMSQSLLANAEGFLTWGWSQDEGSVYKGTFCYYGLGVNLTLSASYGGKQVAYLGYTYIHNEEEENRYDLALPTVPKLSKFYDVTATASLPLYFEQGYRTRYVGLTASWNLSNGLVARVRRLANLIDINQLSRIPDVGYKQGGVHKLQFSASYQNTVRMAHKDFLPRQGHLLQVAYALNPADIDFSQLIALYGKLYLPGLFPHHSLTISGLYQTSFGGFESPYIATNLSFRSAHLIPRGFTNNEIDSRNYVAASVNYQFPLCYPEGGIPSLLYFKRIRLNLGFDYASFDKLQFYAGQGQKVATLASQRSHMLAYGGDLTFDINLIRLPSAGTVAVTLSVYKPHGKKGMYISGGLGLPF